MKSAAFILCAAIIMAVTIPVLGQAAEPAGGAAGLSHDIAAAIERTESETAPHHLSDDDTRSLIQQAIQAVIIQSGAEPDTVLAALSSLPDQITHLPGASAAISAVKFQVIRLEAQSRAAGNPGAAAAPAGNAPIISAPPPSAGNGSGGGSDYRHG